MGDFYEAEAEDMIRRAERRTQDSLEDFYRGLVRACNVLRERLELAQEELPPDVAADIRRDLGA